jgi:hypothetical protein
VSEKKNSTDHTLGDHLNTCTAHSGVKKVHDWMVDQLPDLFHTTHKVKTQQVVKSRGQHCGDIDLAGYLVNESGPVSSVMPHGTTARAVNPRHDGTCGHVP